jgi:hypothetical protein
LTKAKSATLQLQWLSLSVKNLPLIMTTV